LVAIELGRCRGVDSAMEDIEQLAFEGTIGDVWAHHNSSYETIKEQYDTFDLSSRARGNHGVFFTLLFAVVVVFF